MNVRDAFCNVKWINKALAREPANDATNIDLWHAAKAGSETARRDIMERNGRYVAGRVRDLCPWLNPSDNAWQDYFAQGMTGLLIGIQKFDPTKRVPFLAYAKWWIDAEIKSSRRKDSVVKVARDKRNPDAMRDPMRLAARQVPITLDESQCKYLEDVDRPEETVSSREYVRVMRDLVARLSRRDRTIVTRHLLEGVTLADIGKELKISRERVRQLEAKAVARLVAMSRTEHPRLPGEITREIIEIKPRDKRSHKRRPAKDMTIAAVAAA